MLTLNTEEEAPQFTTEALTKLFPQYVFVNETQNSTGEFREFAVLIPTEARHASVRVVDVGHLDKEEVNQVVEQMNQHMKLRHHSMIQTKKFWCHETYLFILTNEVHGVRLDKLIDEGRFSLKRTLEVAIQIAALLEYLHEQKSYHGGLCPQAIYVDRHYSLSVDPGYFVQLLLGDNKVLSNGPYVYDFTASPSRENASRCERSVDINALGSIVCYLSTGYTPNMLAPSRWESYGLDVKLFELVARATGHEDYHFFARVDEISEVLESVQSANFSADSIGRACMKTKLHRLSATQMWTPEVTQLNQVAESQERLRKTDENLLNNRYRMGDCFEISPVKRVFNAEDTAVQNKAVWMHMYDFNGDPQWSFDFRTLAQKLYSMKHPHICQVHDFALLKDVGYIATHREMGEKFVHFARRHHLSWEAIVAFIQQVGGALAVAVQSGFQGYFMSPDSIAVYGNREGDYFYRLMNIGYSEVLEMSGDEDFCEAFTVKQPEWVVPRLEKGEFAGFKTTQGILGNMVLQLICRYHPCEHSSLEECERFHRLDAKQKVAEYAPGLSKGMQKWLAMLLEPNVENRFETPQMMLIAFMTALNQGENSVE